MRSALYDFQIFVVNAEYYPVFLIDTDAPVSGEAALQRLRLPCALIAVAVYVSQQLIYLFERLLVPRLPSRYSAQASSCHSLSIIQPLSAHAASKRFCRHERQPPAFPVQPYFHGCKTGRPSIQTGCGSPSRRPAGKYLSR